MVSVRCRRGIDLGDLSYSALRAVVVVLALLPALAHLKAALTGWDEADEPAPTTRTTLPSSGQP
ncbi:MAG: hypothetical protein MUC74_16345 [Ideonella sp.]|jgi:hypothetical protein|nr:hypothetical protein [Ideonella sp.]